jgi:hypothetical protein
MTEIGLIRYASGDWTPGNPYVRVRIEADELEEPQDLSIALSDVGAFVTLLLALSGKAGTGGQPGAVAEEAFPLPLDSVGLGQYPTARSAGACGRLLRDRVGAVHAIVLSRSAAPVVGGRAMSCRSLGGRQCGLQVGDFASPHKAWLAADAPAS